MWEMKNARGQQNYPLVNNIKDNQTPCCVRHRKNALLIRI